MDDFGYRREEPVEVSHIKSMTIEQFESSLRITYRWFKPSAIALAIFATCWNCIVFMMVSNTYPYVNIAIIFFAVLGLLVAYATLLFIFNSIIIDASVDELRIRHRPLPVWGNKSLDPVDIEQIFCKEHEIKRTDNNTGKVSYTYFYSIRAVTLDGQVIVLIRFIPDKDQAKHIERMLERSLAIKDRVVVGEVKD